MGRGGAGMAKWTDYCTYWSFQNFTTKIDDAERAFATSQLPGAKIMKMMNQNARSGDDEATKVELLFRAFVEYSRDQANWRWLGATPCGTPKVLDNNNAQLECQGFVIGLRALMIYPPPFGLGISPTNCSVETHNPKLGSESCGFVARHPRDGAIGLAPNIDSPAEIDDTLFPGGFYLWANHKVLKYGGKLFDPSYGRQYLKKEDMVYLSVTGFGVDGVEDSKKPSTLLAFESAAETDNSGNYYFMCQYKGSRNYKIKYHKVADRAEGFEYHGPFPAV
jgi:hypothetical protein